MSIPLSAAEIRNCLNCQHEFKVWTELHKRRNHWCSLACRADFKLKQDRANKAEKDRYRRNMAKAIPAKMTHICLFCSQPMMGYQAVRPLCSANCRVALNKSQTIAHIKNKDSVRHYSSTVRKFNRDWNAKLASLPCAHCGYAKHVELAHIRAVADFPDTATLGEVNAPDNVLPLCPNCHWEFDNLERK
jgi:hypothetical protein